MIFPARAPSYLTASACFCIPRPFVMYVEVMDRGHGSGCGCVVDDVDVDVGGDGDGDEAAVAVMVGGRCRLAADGVYPPA